VPAGRFQGTAPAVLRLSGGSTALGAKRSASPGGESDSGIAGMSMSASSKSSSPKKAKAKSPARSPAKSPAKRQATSTAVEDLEKARWEAQKAGDLEVLSTRESVLKRPDMWIGDVSTVLKMAWEVAPPASTPPAPPHRARARPCRPPPRAGCGGEGGTGEPGLARRP